MGKACAVQIDRSCLDGSLVDLVEWVEVAKWLTYGFGQLSSYVLYQHIGKIFRHLMVHL